MWGVELPQPRAAEMLQQERPRRHARNAGRQAGREIVADRQQADQQRHRQRIGGKEIVDPLHPRAKTRRHQRPADDPRIEEREHATEFGRDERQQCAKANAKGVAAEETDDVTRHC